MVKHIILWTLNPELSDVEKESVKQGIKDGLEGLLGKVPGLKFLRRLGRPSVPSFLSTFPTR